MGENVFLITLPTLTLTEKVRSVRSDFEFSELFCDPPHATLSDLEHGSFGAVIKHTDVLIFDDIVWLAKEVVLHEYKFLVRLAGGLYP